MREFVIVVDAQADFMLADGALPVPGADALIAPLDAWLTRIDPDTTAGVLFTFDTHDADTYPRSAEAALFPPHCLRGTPGWAGVLDAAGIDPAVPRYRIEKGVFDMWAEPDLVVERMDVPAAAPVAREASFARLREDGVDRVVVVGVAADYCVRWAIEGLLARGFAVTVPTDLTRGIERGMTAVAADLGTADLMLS